MRTFSQKPKQPQKPTSSYPVRPNIISPKPDHDPQSAWHSRRMSGDQVVQQDSLEGFNAGSTSPVSPRFSHDFSQIPVHSKSSTRIQPKLTVGAPGDKYEQEADRVADQVMRIPDAGIQRKCDSCEEEKLQQKPLIQRKVSGSGTQMASREVASGIAALRGSGRPLDKGISAELGSKMGADFSGVNIHTDSRAIQLSQDLGARAFTVRNDIYFNKGQYNPASGEGKRLMVHELVHTLQNKRNEAQLKSLTIKRKENEEGCPARAKGEVSRSENSKINLDWINTKSEAKLPMRTYTVPAHMTWLIHDFAVGKDNIASNKLVSIEQLFAPLMEIIRNVERDRTLYYGFRVTGFSDCRGGDSLNKDIRKQRALYTANLLSSVLGSFNWPDNRSIEIKYNTVGATLFNNSSEKNRAYNRSGIIEVKMYEMEHKTTPPGVIKEKGKQKLGIFLMEAKRKLKKEKTGGAERLLCIIGMLYELQYDSNKEWTVNYKNISDDYFSFRNVVGYLTQLPKANKDGWEVPPDEFAESSINNSIIAQAYRSPDVDSFISGLKSLDKGIVDGNNYLQRELSLRVVTPGYRSPLSNLTKWVMSRQNNKNHFYNCWDSSNNIYSDDSSEP